MQPYKTNHNTQKESRSQSRNTMNNTNTFKNSHTANKCGVKSMYTSTIEYIYKYLCQIQKQKSNPRSGTRRKLVDKLHIHIYRAHIVFRWAIQSKIEILVFTHYKTFRYSEYIVGGARVVSQLAVCTGTFCQSVSDISGIPFRAFDFKI